MSFSSEGVDLRYVESLWIGPLILVLKHLIGQSELHIREPQEMIDHFNRLSLILSMVACGHLTAGGCNDLQ